MNLLKINYVEFETADIAASRTFLAQAFGWAFVDYGPDYAAMSNAGLDGGVTSKANDKLKAPLVILKADNLEDALVAVTKAGGVILKPPFSFPGGRRFHFREPGGNEMAVWSEK
jgi:hypothetical protein